MEANKKNYKLIIKALLAFYLGLGFILLISLTDAKAKTVSDCNLEFDGCVSRCGGDFIYCWCGSVRDTCIKEAQQQEQQQQQWQQQQRQALEQQQQQQRELEEEQQRGLEELQKEQQYYEEQKRVSEELSKLQNRLSSEIIDEYNRLTGNERSPSEAEISGLLSKIKKIKKEWNDLAELGKEVGISSVNVRDEYGNIKSIDEYAKELEGYLNTYLERVKAEDVKSKIPPAPLKSAPKKESSSRPKPKLEAGKNLTDLDLNLLDTLKLPVQKFRTAREMSDFIQAKREIQNSTAEFIKKNGGTLEKTLKTKGGSDYLKALQQETLKRNPADVNANLMLGKIYQLEGKSDMALEFNKKSLENIDNEEVSEFINQKLKEVREAGIKKLKISEGFFTVSPALKKIDRGLVEAAQKAGMGLVRGKAVEQLSRCALSNPSCNGIIDGVTELNK